MDRDTIGVISDTHGLLRPEAVTALGGCSLIIHAGDIGGPAILDRLGAIAPVAAVRGNTDSGEWAMALPKTEVVEIAGLHIYVIHDLMEIDLDPAAAGFNAVICGHTHRPVIEDYRGTLLINPGSAGPRRFELPVSVALILIRDGALEPLLVDLG
jgi:putative phosphoesterase